MELYEKIRDKYGIDEMQKVWIEELLELALILQQDLRPDKEIDRDKIIKEFVDVSICMSQMLEVWFTDMELFKSDLMESEILSELPKKLNLQ